MPENASILLIDGEGQTRQRVSRVLGKAGWNVTASRNGAAGIDADSAEEFAVVVLGIPRAGGNDLLAAVRAQCPNAPVIALVNPGDSRSAADALNNGAFACLARSFHPEELRAAAQRAAELYALRKENQRLKQRVASLCARSVKRSGEYPDGWSMREVERAHIRRVLTHTGWNRTAAARLLGIDRKTLRNRIREFALEPEGNSGCQTP